ncbi:MAG: nucleoside triphosphate pyrophosphohydrolase [Defluviitaleaceae bacterium]|nr:nucleoside triphosphate pyrophosphohydrolase [Defluviitaleaceae bacterium]
MTAVYGKLIRDNIPEIIIKQGKTPIIRTLSRDEYIYHLKIKLLEEVNEYITCSNIEEICDIYEVIDAIKKTEGYLDADIEAVKTAKAIKNGKFDKRLFLEKVEV